MSLVMAAIQMTSSARVEDNLKAAEHWVAKAHEQGAQLVVLPENFAIFDGGALFEAGENEATTGRLSNALAAWAKRYGVWIVGGTLPSRFRLASSELVPGRRVRTRSAVYSPAGECVAAYDKIHLFDVDVADAHGSYRESDAIEPGNLPVVAKLPDFGLGLTICYDLRFPELFAHLRQLGASVITVPSAFTYVTGKAHWLPLLQARAIETQCFIVAANQVGENRPSRRTWGHSCIISPWGEVLALKEDGEGVVMASVDLMQLEEVRKKMPVLQHKRFHVAMKE